MAKKKVLKQQTLEATMGKSRVRGAVINQPKKKAVTDTSNGHASQSSPSSTMVVRSSPRNHSAPPSSAPTAFSAMQTRSSPLVPKKSNQRKRAVLDSDSDEAEKEEEEDLPALPPPKRMLGKRSRVKREDSSDDDLILTSPRKKRSLGKSIGVKVNDESSDSEDRPLATPVSASRPKRNVVLDDSDEQEDEEPQQLSSPTKRRRLIRRGGDLGSIREDDEQPAPRSSQAARRKPRTEKEKARELLRRKRAGETINEEDLKAEEEDDEEVAPKKALYDSDSDNMALKEFEDDDEGVLDPTHAAKTEGSPDKKKRPKKKKQISSDSDSDNSDANSSASGRGSGDEDEEGSEDDWVVDDVAIGVPDDLMTEIPLEFTKHSHKPLKEHFRDVIEWCVQNKVNPGFAEKQHAIYGLGWQKLDDEVRGLAQSKFASSAWKKDFFMALRARPYYKDEEVGGMQNTFGLENCGACGRSGHPAKYRMQFLGAPYYKSFNSPMFLEAVDSKGEASSSSSSPSSASSSDDDEGDSNDNTKEVVDEDGNVIEPSSKTWMVGTVCHSNAETAHSLLHWKFALYDWVDANLEAGGYMKPDKLKERLKWKPRKKYKLVDKILKKWVEQGVISRLWREFKDTIETARNKSTTGRGQR
ncbi:protein of unknown function (DUF4211) domain containing protein [Rhypophila sp. PSN 637]